MTRKRRPKVRVLTPHYTEKSGVYLIDFEFGDWRDFFLRPEDKFTSLKNQKGYQFIIEIPPKSYNQKPIRYILDDITDNIVMLKLFIPERPPKRTWYFLDLDKKKETTYNKRYYFRPEKLEMAEFGYNITLVK